MSNKFNYKKIGINMTKNIYKERHNIGEPVSLNELYVGKKIHLSYTNFACVWKIVSIEPKDEKGDIWINLISASGKKKRTKAIYACHIRKDEKNIVRNTNYQFKFRPINVIR